SMVRRVAARHPGRVALGLDARRGEVAVRGWTEGTGRGAEDVLARFQDAGLGAVVVTDIARDGTLEGPDLGGLASVLTATSLPVIASGGVGSVGDLRALAGLEAGGRTLAGVIVGKALHEGAFTVGEAMAACAPSG
ncbi:MAG: HisA/HisF-related TIM barrel protein, partial [Actinomycetota bacterium]|nr:HisA/HisF-related TIM barrel protein [Actinomycetota bacterium]